MTSVSVPDRSEHVASTAGSGTGLTLVHEDGLPKWVAVTDAAMPLVPACHEGVAG